MNKALHIFVYLFLIIAGGVAYLVYEIYPKKEELADRNDLMKSYIERFYNTLENPTNNIEKAEVKSSKNLTDYNDYLYDTGDTDADDLAKKDGDPLSNWEFKYELANETKDWANDGHKGVLKDIYANPNAVDKTTRDSKAEKVLQKMVDDSVAQREQLKQIRVAYKNAREGFKPLVKEINELKPEVRKLNRIKKELEEDKKLLEEEKQKLNDTILDNESTINDLNGKIVDQQNNINQLNKNIEEANKAYEKEKELTENLKKKVADLLNSLRNVTTIADGNAGEVGAAVSSVAAGTKGKIIEVNNDAVFAIIEVTPEAMKELKGNDASRPLPLLEYVVTRPGFKGPAGEIVGRIRLRQEVPGKNWIICDILANWSQDSLKKDDVIVAD